MLIITDKDVRALLQQNQNRYWKQLNAELIEQRVKQFRTWPAPQASDPEHQQTRMGQQAQRVAQFLLYDIAQTVKKINAMQRAHSKYCAYYGRAAHDDERHRFILDYARELGATRRQLKQDKRALKRWFGHDTVLDRYLRRHQTLEREITFMLHCLGRVTALTLTENGTIIGYKRLWMRLGLEDAIKPLLSYSGDPRVVTEAFHALSTALKGMPRDSQQNSVGERTLQYIYRSALQPSQQVWIQCEALQLLESLAPESLQTALHKRLSNPRPGDDLFVRRQAVILLGRNLVYLPQLRPLIALALKDPSAYVRQVVPQALESAGRIAVMDYLPGLLHHEAVPQVRAAALLSLVNMFEQVGCFNFVLTQLLQSLTEDDDEFVVRVAMKTTRDWLLVLQTPDKEWFQPFYYNSVMPVLEELHQTADSLSVRRWAAQTREYLYCQYNPKSKRLHAQLQTILQDLRAGKTRRLPKNLRQEDDHTLGRIMAVVAQNDFGCELEHSLLDRYITRGHVFGFRLWRMLHEFRHPSPDKRQAFSHTTGRLFYGTIRAPSAILSELAETKVPGEPLYMASEGGWRAYLPLVDEVISSLTLFRSAKPVYIYSSEGITELIPPTRWFKRQWAWCQLTLYFTQYAHLRNWDEENQESAQRYLQALQALGIQVIFKGHSETQTKTSEDPMVRRFFPVPLVIPVPDRPLWSEFKDYFFSIYQNSLLELMFFISLAIGYFISKHIYLYQKLRKARRSIPLVIGGWGTRGKSGTERIKAALMNALGYSIVSKTSGCEAMFLHAYPFGKLKEMFLFRPYDKATIWEQHNLVCLSAQMNSEVFLWECMGLTPSYVELLQRQWMRDDLSTITNTYPDHEDLQGPAGINIPQVMTRFIPKNSVLFSSEEQMQPILEQGAQAVGTQIHSVNWLDAGLLTPDVLTRFPYDEHPFNIALVIAMAKEMGISEAFALKEMADRVIADIGVLKTYPPAPWRSRVLEFVNGMSANERFGCLGNWTRLGFDKTDYEQQPNVWISTVINNRSDRIARSRVFASIIAKDISFDRCLLIGNNLAGFTGYIREAWDEWVGDISLTAASSDSPRTMLLTMAKRFRIPYNQQFVQTRLDNMLVAQTHSIDRTQLLALWDQPDSLATALDPLKLACTPEILRFLQIDLQLLDSYQRFEKQLDKAGTVINDAINQAFHRLLWQWFERKLVVVEDYHATGNKIIEHICDETPPGFHNRIMGMQNIKGTGLDFVYRWQAWENCYNACQQLSDPSPQIAEQGLRTLSSFQEYGVACEETVRATVTQILKTPVAQSERYQAELRLIIDQLDTALAKAQAQMSVRQSNSGFFKILATIEAFLDAGDAVKRRKQANQIYQDMAAERISHDRAVLELQALNKRQKGGWLTTSIQARFSKKQINTIENT